MDFRSTGMEVRHPVGSCSSVQMRDVGDLDKVETVEMGKYALQIDITELADE